MIYVLMSSLLTVLSMPGFLAGFLVWICLIPLLKAFNRRGPFWGALYGFVFYLLFILADLFWVLPVLTDNLPQVFSRFPSWVGVFVFILMGIVEAFPFAGFGFVYGLAERSIKKNPLREILFTASAYTFFEYLRGLGDMGFTGGRLSDALYRDTGVLQLASIGGSLGLTFLIVAVNVIGYRILRHSTRAYTKIAGLVLTICFISNLVALKLPPITSGGVSITAIQTNTSQDAKYSRTVYHLWSDIKPLLKATKDSVVVLPEDVFPVDIRGTVVENELIRIAQQNNLTVFMGTLLKDEDSVRNAVLAFDADGFKDSYSKVKLFPFVEKLPYEEVFGFLSFLKGMAYLAPGNEYNVFDIEGYPSLGVQICFESYFSEVSRQLVENGAQLLIVCTNDGWFAYNVALKQHFAKSVIRAVETHRQVIQVSNAGITGAVDPYGRIVKIAPLRETAVVQFDAFPSEMRTVSTTAGEYMAFVSAGILIVLLVFPGERSLSVRRRIWK